MDKLKFEDQIRELYGRTVYTHKCHAKMADQCLSKFDTAKKLKLFLTALTGSGAVGVVFADEKLLEVAVALVALATLYWTAYLKDFDLGVLAQRHREAAARIWPVRESYQSLLVDLDHKPIEELVTKRDELQDELAEIYSSVPQTNDKAYKAAQKGLRDNGELSFSDKEIDDLLPAALRRGP